jgi:hypothetical protein
MYEINLIINVDNFDYARGGVHDHVLCDGDQYVGDEHFFHGFVHDLLHEYVDVHILDYVDGYLRVDDPLFLENFLKKMYYFF